MGWHIKMSMGLYQLGFLFNGTLTTLQFIFVLRMKMTHVELNNSLQYLFLFACETRWVSFGLIRVIGPIRRRRSRGHQWRKLRSMSIVIGMSIKWFIEVQNRKGNWIPWWEEYDCKFFCLISFVARFHYPSYLFIYFILGFVYMYKAFVPLTITESITNCAVTLFNGKIIPLKTTSTNLEDITLLYMTISTIIIIYYDASS